MPKKKLTNNRLQQAHEAHAKFLAKFGIDHKAKPSLRGVEREAYTQPPKVTSDTIPANGPRGRAHTPSGGRVIGQAYNKGPLMVLGSKDELANAKRRDR